MCEPIYITNYKKGKPELRAIFGLCSTILRFEIGEEEERMGLIDKILTTSGATVDSGEVIPCGKH